MPSYTRGKKRENLVFVPVNEFMYFGFKPKDLSSITGVSASDITVLGHVLPSAAALGRIRTIGANAPKPPRVGKRLTNASAIQQRSVSTYCSYDQIGAAQNAGWNLIKGRSSVTLRALSAARSSVTAIAELSDDSLYCFPMNKADFQAFGSQLGLKDPATITTENERKRLVSGSSTPYPGRAARLLDDGSTFSSFFSTATDVSDAGYDIISEEKVLDNSQPPF